MLTPLRNRVLIGGLAIVVSLIGGCSSYQMAYNNLDRLLIAYIDDYVDLNSDQRQAILPVIKQWHHQHRQQQLPEYRQWLLEVRRAVNETDSRELNQTVITGWLVMIEQSWLHIRRDALPTARIIVQQLTPNQQQQLVQQLKQELDDKRQQYMQRSPDERVEHRYQIYRKRLQRWSGRLHDSQQQQLQALTAALVDNRLLWLEYRQRWIDQLQQVLALQAETTQFDAATEALLVDPQVLRGDRLRQSMVSNRQQWTLFMSRFINGLSAQQRDHFITELDDLIEDIEQLQ